VSTLDVVTPSLVLEHRPWWRGRPLRVALIVATMIVAYQLWGKDADQAIRFPWPDWLQWNSLVGYLDRFQIWLSDERAAADPSFVFSLFNSVASFLDDLVGWLTRLLLWMTWVGTTAAGTLVALRFGGRRAAMIAFAAFAAFAGLGLWEASMQTLALMTAAVVLSLFVGIPLGIVAGRSDRFLRVITPILDVMQIIPAFAYLMPVVILFSVGPGAAVVTTMIYAIPPAVRITALGIRAVADNTVEAAQAMGSTRAQVLLKVQLPLARRRLLLGVNQTILFALSMVVIAGLIGGAGLGDIVTNGLNTNPALAILAGIAIVVMAIALDRDTEAIADQSDPARRHLTDDLKRRLRLLTLATGVAIVSTIVVARLLGVAAVYPRVTGQEWLLARVQSVLDYIADPSTWLYGVTSRIGNFLAESVLVPFSDFMVYTPWFVTLAGLTAIGFVISGRRAATVTFLMFASIGITGQWEPAMTTASQVLVATVLALAVGVALGVWAAESRRFSQGIRPVNDVLQTLPQLVYIIPFVYLFPVSYVPGVVASVLYAFPVVVRLVESGVRGVEQNTVEAAAAFGASRRQVLMKVKIPLAQDSIMLGVNQGIIMVLGVVVIGGLVGSGGLGYEVAQGLQRGQFGLGVVASLAILALGIALDRVTQGNRKARSDVG
jgi:glycine betaine/proline transport system permease protein